VGPIVPLDQQQREGNFSEGRTSRKLFSQASDASDTESEASDTSTTCTSSLGSKSPCNLSLVKAATNSTCNNSDSGSHLPELEQPEERTCQESRTTPQEEEQEQEQPVAPSSNNDNDDVHVDTDSSDRSAAPTTNKSTTKKKSVGFEPMSTLYVFEDDVSGTNEKGYYDVAKAWYSPYELKAFRAEAFLTVNWMVMKGIGGPESDSKNQEQPKRINKYKNFNQHYKNRNNKNKNYTYYSDKYGYDRQKEINAIAKNADYEFCERGVECRTPIGRFVKNKRRLDAMRVVLLYQQMQKQHRRERRRQERRQQQRQYHEDEESFRKSPMRRRSSLDPKAARQVEAENEAEALANVYIAYCKESRSDALARGKADATAVGMKPATSITTKASPQESSLMDKPYDLSRRQPLTSHLSQNTNKKSSSVECPSLCDEAAAEEEDDQFMDNLVSLSFVHSQDDSDVDDDIDDNSSIVDNEYENDDDDDDSSSISSTSCASPPADDASLNSETSLSLEAVLKSHIHYSFRDEHETLKIEVELVEGSADCDHELSHRIHCSEHERSTTTTTTLTVGSKQHLRSKSWSHPNLGACASLPLTAASDLVDYSSAAAANATPTHSSFSSLELGGLFFGAVSGMEWW